MTDASKPLFKRLDHVAIEVSDVQASEQFYCRYFGFQHHFEHITPGGTLIVYLRLGDTLLELVQVDGASISGGHFALEVSDLHQAMAALSDLSLLQDLHDTPPRHVSEQAWKRVVFAGPDGEAIECRGPYVLESTKA